MEDSIGAYEAKTHLPRLLDDVSALGKTYVITKHGLPVARLAPVRRRDQQPEEVIAELREARKGVRLDGLQLADLIEEGRR